MLNCYLLFNCRLFQVGQPLLYCPAQGELHFSGRGGASTLTWVVSWKRLSGWTLRIFDFQRLVFFYCTVVHSLSY